MAAAQRHCCNRCSAEIAEGTVTVTLCNHSFCASCSEAVFASSSVCPVDGCGIELQQSECVIRDTAPSPSEAAMLLAGHTQATILTALQHALSHSDAQQRHAASVVHAGILASKDADLARAQQHARSLDADLQALQVTVTELSSQLQAERRDSATAARSRVALQTQLNKLTREKIWLEDRVHTLEAAAQKHDSDEDWSCTGAAGEGSGADDNGAAGGLFAMGRAALLYTEQR
jgi:hypothetical protein